MKKVVSIVLVIGLLLSLCACSSSKFVGTWKGIDEYGQEHIVTIKSNGKGLIEYVGGSSVFEWVEISDNRIAIRYQYQQNTFSQEFELDSSNNQQMISNRVIYYKQ